MLQKRVTKNSEYLTIYGKGSFFKVARILLKEITFEIAYTIKTKFHTITFNKIQRLRNSAINSLLLTTQHLRYVSRSVIFPEMITQNIHITLGSCQDFKGGVTEFIGISQKLYCGRPNIQVWPGIQSVSLQTEKDMINLYDRSRGYQTVLKYSNI